MNSFNCRKIRTTRAVLVAISIPIFTAQLEKSREATDAANARAAYAEASVASLEADGATAVSTTPFTIKATDNTYAASGNPVVGGNTMSSYTFTTNETYYCHITIAGDGTETVSFTTSK